MNMVKITVFLTVIVAYILIDRVDSKQRFNVQNFLQALQQQLASEQNQERGRNQPQLYYTKDESESYGSLKKKDVDRLISLSSKVEKNKHDQNDKRSKKQNALQYYLLRRPLSQGNKLVPNDLLGLGDKHDDRSSYETNDRDDERPANRHNEYSKVYVVLNSEAIKKSKNKDKLNALLSSLLAPPPQESVDRYQEQQELYQDERGRFRDNQNSYQNKLNRYQDKQSRYQVANDRDQSKQDRYRSDHERYRDVSVWIPEEDDRYSDEHDRYRDERDQYQSESDRYQSQRDQYDRSNRKKERRYKGFLINDDPFRRKLHDSGEIYQKEMIENERPMAKPISRPREKSRGLREKPRRQRDRGGGGGGGGGGNNGHTAIPYIRQHGDIYERED